MDAEELQQAMAESGRDVTLEEAGVMISKHDKNSSGTIGFDEFALMMKDHMDGDDFLASAMGGFSFF